MKKTPKAVKAWMCENDYTRQRGYSFLHIQEQMPNTDADFKCYPIFVKPRPLTPLKKKGKVGR